MKKIEVNEGKLPWVVGIGTILFGILLMILMTLYQEDSAALMTVSYLIAALIMSAGIWMCIDGRNRKLTVEDMAICYTNWFGRKKEFSLDEIGYCKAALETGSKDYLKVFNLLGEKLCKLEFNMHNSILFLQYLLDNQVKIECSEKSDSYLKGMINTTAICAEEIPAVVNAAYEEVKTLVWEWLKNNSKFGVEWKMGIVSYLGEELSEKKQMWEQESYDGPPPYIQSEESSNEQINLPEGYLIVIEGYLQKDGEFVIDRKNHAVTFYVPVICVSKSMQIGETFKIRYFSILLEELSAALDTLVHTLPRNRYHTEMISLKHELKERL